MGEGKSPLILPCHSHVYVLKTACIRRVSERCLFVEGKCRRGKAGLPSRHAMDVVFDFGTAGLTGCALPAIIAAGGAS